MHIRPIPSIVGDRLTRSSRPCPSVPSGDRVKSFLARFSPSFTSLLYSRPLSAHPDLIGLYVDTLTCIPAMISYLPFDARPILYPPGCLPCFVICSRPLSVVLTGIINVLTSEGSCMFQCPNPTLATLALRVIRTRETRMCHFT